MNSKDFKASLPSVRDEPPVGQITSRRTIVSFTPQQLIDLGSLLVVCMENFDIQIRAKRDYGISPDTLSDLALKLKKEVDKL